MDGAALGILVGGRRIADVGDDGLREAELIYRVRGGVEDLEPVWCDEDTDRIGHSVGLVVTLLDGAPGLDGGEDGGELG